MTVGTGAATGTGSGVLVDGSGVGSGVGVGSTVGSTVGGGVAARTTVAGGGVGQFWLAFDTNTDGGKLATVSITSLAAA